MNKVLTLSWHAVDFPEASWLQVSLCLFDDTGGPETYNLHWRRLMLPKPNFVSKHTVFASYSGWRQVKSSTPSKKRGQRENSHGRNRHPELSFHGFCFKVTIYCIGWGWTHLSLSREDATSSSGFGLDFGLLGHQERFGLPTGVWALLGCQHIFALWLLLHGLGVCPLEAVWEELSLSWFLFSHEAL